MPLLFAIENGFSARYLLRSAVLDTVLAAQIPVVVATPNAHEAYFQQTFAARGVRVIPQPPLPPLARWREQLEMVRLYGPPGSHPGTNIDIKYRSYLQRQPLRPALLWVFDQLVQAHRRTRWVRHALTHTMQQGPWASYRQLLREHGVKLLVLDGIGGTGPHVANWARGGHNVCRTATAITNWDHPSTKGYRSTASQRYFVWGQAMQQELAHYHDLPATSIEQVGSALFDVYAQPQPHLDRLALCQRFGLAPERPIVLYIANSPVNFPYNSAIVQFLAEQLAAWPNAPQLLVRLHPLHLKATPAETAQHTALAQRPGVAYSHPRILSQTLVPDMDAEEIGIAAALVQHTEVMVNFFSTMQLDACLCDKPIINIGFDWDAQSTSSQKASLFAGYAHLQRLVQAEVATIAQSPNDLLALIQAALAHPTRQAPQRHQLAQREGLVVDGQASARLGAALVKQYSLQSV